MFDEIEKFIKKVAEAAEQAQRQEQPRREPPRSPKKQKPAGQQPQKEKQATKRISAPSSSILEPQILDAELADGADGISKKVARDLQGSDQISAHANRLGMKLHSTDENMDAHVHQSLDHQIGTLKRSSTQAAEVTVQAQSLHSAEILKIFRSADGIRSAFIISEMLRRPEENW